MWIKFAVLAFSLFTVAASAQEVSSIGPGNGFRVFGGGGDDINGVPWYGLGGSTFAVGGASQGAVQLAGYFGLNLQTASGQMVMTQYGNVGIGLATPSYPLDMIGNIKTRYSGADATGVVLGSAGGSYPQIQFNAADNSQRFKLQVNDINTAVERLSFYAGPLGQNANHETMVVAGTGRVGIGTTSPGASLEVNGSVKLTSGSGASMTYPDGTVQSTAWNGTTFGGDYAESVDVAVDKSGYEPGDIIVIDSNAHGKFLKSAEPYSTMVAGIYSTKPGLLGRRQGAEAATGTAAIPMALVGIVPTKVSVENGPIKDGDLLVTSSTPGVAMKGTDPAKMMGAVVGKALNRLDSGTGVIEVLIWVQ